MPYLVSYRVPIWRVHHSKTNRPMDPISHEALHCTPNQHSRGLTFVKGRLWSAPEAMRCEQGVFFCNIPFLHVSTWEAARATFQSAPSGAHMWNGRSLVSSHCVLKDWSITQSKPKIL